MLKKIIPFLFLLVSVYPAAADNHLATESQLLPVGTAEADHYQTVDLGSDVYRGVVATAQLKRLPESVEGGALPAGKGQYLLTVSFSGEQRGEVLSKGAVAVKITSPEERISEPVRLDPTEGIFQAAILLDLNGESLVKIGSKLADDNKRIYRFFYTPDF